MGSLELLNLKQYQRLVVFCGPRHKKINFGDIPTESFCHLELIRMASTGNNNLDFHLALYLGVHHLEAGKEIEFHVVSKDKGFDGVIAHLESIGRKCRRVGGAKKKAVAKKTAKKVTKKVAKKVAKKAAKKVAKKAVAKKAVKDHQYSSLKIAQAIQSLDSEDRPRSLIVLEQWIMAKLDVPEYVARGIYKKLIREGRVLIEGDRVGYSFRPME